MSFLQFPERIYSGIDSINKIFDNDYKRILVLCDSRGLNYGSFLSGFEEKSKNNGVEMQTIIQDDFGFMFDSAQKLIISFQPEIIIAAGDGKISDCAMELSSLYGIPYCSVPCSAPTALIENDSVDAFLTRRVPEIAVLDPELATTCDSGKIAYEGLGMLCLSAESFTAANNSFIKPLAKKAFHRIYRNLFSAYTGEISARENLLEGMYWAYISYVNSHSFSWESPCYRLYELLRESGVPGLSLIAVSCVQIIESLYSDCCEEFEKLILGMGFKTCADAVEDMRKLRARLSVPGCIKNLNTDENYFLSQLNKVSDEDGKLFMNCFYSVLP